MAGISHNLSISATSIPNTGAPVVVGGLTFTGVTEVNVLSGQQLPVAPTTFTLDVEGAPSTYPTSGNLLVNVTDEFGNGDQIQVSYTGTSGSTFTGCTNVNGQQVTTVVGPAAPMFTGSVSINRTGSGHHPWLNTLTSASVLAITIQSSEDGGTTWQDEASVTAVGGTVTNPKTGIADTTVQLNVGPVNPSVNAVQMLCAATGPSAVEISGSGAVTSV